jgi:uncharacterized protein (TIGR03086 family)
MDIKQLYLKADDYFSRLLVQVKDDDWDKATPDSQWKVRDLVNHVVGEELWTPELLAGKTIAEVGDKFDGDVVGADPKAAWSEAAKLGKTAVARMDDLSAPVHLSFGDFPAFEYLGQMVIDRVIHGWDLAKGVGADATIDDELAQAAYDLLKDQAEQWRAGGAFGPKVEVPEAARVQDKLLAISGRTP